MRNAVVKLKLLDVELSSRFLGATRDITLLEADAQLVGLISSPARESKSKLTDGDDEEKSAAG